MADLHEGDCREVMAGMEANSFDSIVTDPPYGLEFMGKEWDRIGGGRTSKPGIGDRTTPWVSNRGWNSHRCAACGHLPHGGSPCVCESPDIRPVDNRWQEMQEWYHLHFAQAIRVLKPGSYALIFGGTRTYHRLTCAVEDAGFEVRDCLMWVYGTGFPKGQGCLKPAWEPIILARKPGKGVLPLGIDACRVETAEDDDARRVRHASAGTGDAEQWRTGKRASDNGGHPAGRWPANVVHDGSDEVMEMFAAFGERTSGARKAGEYQPQGFYGNAIAERPAGMERPMPALEGSTGTAARFFYCAKASKTERGEGNTHPTVKPLALMQWLVRLVTPPGGTVLDPFAGSGTTLLAAEAEGMRATGIEQDAGHCAIIRKRLADAKPVAEPEDLGLLAGFE